MKIRAHRSASPLSQQRPLCSHAHMVALVESRGGRSQGDKRAEDGLRPEGERSIYLFVPDNNRLQITALAPGHKDELLDDEEKWRRIIAARKEQGKGLSKWESGGKKLT